MAEIDPKEAVNKPSDFSFKADTQLNIPVKSA